MAVIFKCFIENFRMKKYILSVLIGSSFFSLFAQKAIVKGIIRDAESRNGLAEASVFELNSSNKVLSNSAGEYNIQVNPGTVSLVFNYVGYSPDTVTYTLNPSQTKTDNVALKYSDKELNTVVFSVGKSAKRIQKESVTIEVFKPRIIENNNITNVLQLVNKVPGVTTMDGSVSIRGGGGFSYGSGSRVMMVIDDMPLITPDRGEIKWEFVPLENIAQVEVLKGAASVQYGSSALNGVIQLTTANPTDSPHTSFTTYTELFDNPPKASYKWWAGDTIPLLDKPHTVGITFGHRRKIKDFEYSFGGNLNQTRSHLRSESDSRARLSFKLRYLPSKLNNRLILGLAGSTMWRKYSDQMFWKGMATPYEAAPGVSIYYNYFYLTIDPSITYMDKRNNQVRLLTRWFHQQTLADPNGRPKFDQFYTDLQYRHDFGNFFKVLVGINNTHFSMQDNTLGMHKGNQGGVYLQGDLNWKGLSATLGARLEYFNLDSVFKLLPIEVDMKNGKTFKMPILRLGLNYQFKRYNYIRFGIGSAYRYGSIAERFVTYDLAVLHILPNPTIKPESGFTAELGYKRSFAIGKNWRGYADAAIFFNQFKQMIEFDIEYAKYIDGTVNGYFRSKNVSRARIFGWEFALVGEGTIGPVDLSFQGGYTYFLPVDLTKPAASNDIGWLIKKAFQSYVKTDSLTQTALLSYRNRHTFKFDVDALLFKRVRLGTSVFYYSYMQNIAEVFNFAVPDLREARNSRNGKGDWQWDLRIGGVFTKNISANFIIKNVLNNDFAVRVAKPNPPRSYTIQLNFRF